MDYTEYYYDTEIRILRGDTAYEYHPQIVLREKKAVCYGYASLFKYLCRAAGIPCRVVTGRRGVYEGEVHPRLLASNHAWNEAYVNGRWVIADVMLDSYNSYEKGEYKEYGNNSGRRYFDPSIEFFSADHLYIREQDNDLVWEKVETEDNANGNELIIIGELPEETIKRLQSYPYTYGKALSGFGQFMTQQPKLAKLVVENLSTVLVLRSNEVFLTNEKLFYESRRGCFYMARGVEQVKNKDGTITEQDLEVEYFYGINSGDPRL